MAFRFNFTGRNRIDLEELEVRPVEGEPKLTVYFTRKFKNGAEYGGDDLLVVEAYRVTKAQRIELGALKDVPEKKKIVFDGFADPLNVRYRVKVVDPVTRRLKGLAKSVTPSDAPDKPTALDPLLPVGFADPEDGLGDRLWKVSFPATGPVLLINAKRLTSDSVKTPEFKSLVWPAALESVLVCAFLRNADSHPAWAEKWKTYVTDMLGVEGAPEEWDQDKCDLKQYAESAAEWIDAACIAFSRQFGLSAVAVKGLTKEESND